VAIFLISLVLIIFVVLWRNGFFRRSPAVCSKRQTHDKKGERGNGKTDTAIAKEPIRLAGKVQIPEWHATWYARWDQVTPRHQQFYQYWVKQLDKDDFINIGKNVGYVFIHMKLAINRFKKDRDIKYLWECFKKLQRAYGEKKDVRIFLGGWLLHAYLFLDDYNGAWAVRKDMGFYDFLDISDIIFFGRKCSRVSIDGEALISILKSRPEILTEFGKNHQREIANVGTRFLSSFHEKHGKNLIEWLHEQLAHSSPSEEPKKSDSSKIIALFDAPCPGIYFNSELSRGVYTHDICSAISSPEHAPTREIQYAVVPQSIEERMKTVLRKLLRECENIIRKERGLPKVGEGWFSETELFEKLCQSFPNERVVHHGQPAWLGQQHLDVYFPSRNVAVEYQGAQHQHLVEFFGGEKVFKKQQERDMRKRQLCEKYGCRLIYAYPGYNISDIQHQIAGNLAYGPPTVRNERAPTDSLAKPVSEEKRTNQQHISLVIPAETLSERPIERLILLANECDRSVNYLVVEAILEYLDREESGVLEG